MKFWHGLFFHGLLVCGFISESWWVEITRGRKLMYGEKCVRCGKRINIRPAGVELEFYDA